MAGNRPSQAQYVLNIILYPGESFKPFNLRRGFRASSHKLSAFSK